MEIDFNLLKNIEGPIHLEIYFKGKDWLELTELVLYKFLVKKINIEKVYITDDGNDNGLKISDLI